MLQNLLGYSEKSDVYSVGISTCEMANGVVPYADMPALLMLTEKLSDRAPQLLDCYAFPAIEKQPDGKWLLNIYMHILICIHMSY
jgi:STE20-related kinase adapter protein alpha